MARRLRLVVLGMMGRCPYGGQTWVYLNWLRGFHRLGHEVTYVEDDTVWPFDPSKNAVTDDCSYAVRHIAHSLEGIGLPDRWAYRLADRRGACWGRSNSDLRELYRTCDALLNVAGAVDLREEHAEARFRVYLETDPVTAELRLAAGDPHTRSAFSAHHAFATYGENYGLAGCSVPLGGIRWVKTRQPIDLDLWPVSFAPSAEAFTTIGNYRQEGADVEYQGELYRWSKHWEWEKILDLPSRTTQKFRPALVVRDPTDQARLRAHGWEVVSPLELSLDIFGSYPAFIRGSRAELTVAKDQNVRFRSGWFSDRDACYLASGKPVVIQDTGFSGVLPTGMGLHAFGNIEEALAAVEAVNADYQGNCEAARALAETCFRAEDVARRLLVDLGL